MTIEVKPIFQSEIADDPAATAAGEVTPTRWNDGSAITQATARILGRVTAADGATEELTAGQVATFLAAEFGAYQPVDSDLTAIAALTTTAFGRAVLALADAAALRTAAGLGTVATLEANTFTGLQTINAPTAISQPRPNDNSDRVLFQTTVPPEGRAQEAPFEWYQAGAVFESEWNPVMYLGYNCQRTVVTEPSMRFVIESNYKHGTRDVEAYWEYIAPASLGSGVWRPFFIFKNKATAVGGESVILTAEEFHFAGMRAAPVTMKLEPTNGNQPFKMTMPGGYGTANGLNQYFVLTAGQDETSGATIRMFGNTCTSADGDKGVLHLIGGNVTSPTAASTQGCVTMFTGATPTQRFRLQPDGNIAIAKPGVAATALVHLGAGTATAGTAPLKLTSGTNLTTAENGAFEYDGTNLTFTTGGTRNIVAPLGTIATQNATGIVVDAVQTPVITSATALSIAAGGSNQSGFLKKSDGTVSMQWGRGGTNRVECGVDDGGFYDNSGTNLFALTGGALTLAISGSVRFTDGAWYQTIDTGLKRNAAGVLEINNGTTGTLRDMKLRNIVGQTGYSEMVEMTAPAAPAANTVRLYAEDNGSGKTRIMALFPSGAAAQIAIEP